MRNVRRHGVDTMTIMPVITVRQPWPWAMFDLAKDVENRTWPTKHRGPILIHASQWSRRGQIEKDLFHALSVASLAAIKALKVRAGFWVDDLKPQSGGIVGIVTIEDCVQNYPSPWAMPDHWHWVLADARPLPFFACKGRLGIWRVDYPHSLAA